MSELYVPREKVRLLLNRCLRMDDQVTRQMGLILPQKRVLTARRRLHQATQQLMALYQSLVQIEQKPSLARKVDIPALNRTLRGIELSIYSRPSRKDRPEERIQMLENTTGLTRQLEQLNTGAVAMMARGGSRRWP